VDSFSEAVARVSTANSGGFTGVRVDLDKDYQPGESFQVQFVVLQADLVERMTSEKKWRINFTPGWYDNAITAHLQINLVSPVNTEAYSLLEPQPVTNNNTFTWEKSNVPGEPVSTLTLNAWTAVFSRPQCRWQARAPTSGWLLA
jgi:hypothetical protein